MINSAVFSFSPFQFYSWAIGPQQRGTEIMEVSGKVVK
jgi:hypothetical protein